MNRKGDRTVSTDEADNPAPVSRQPEEEIFLSGLTWSGKKTGEQHGFDPSHLNDPIAIQTDWTPARSGGASFRTHGLVRVNANRMEFRASLGAKIFYLAFLFAGIGLLVFLPKFAESSGGISFDMSTIVPLLVGLIFVIIGSCLYYFGVAPIVFDRQKGFFWKGRRGPEKTPGRKDSKKFAELENIHALQLISEFIKSDKNSYTSYELNIVLKDGRRINVVDHGRKEKLREDAETLGAFLEKPIWAGYE